MARVPGQTAVIVASCAAILGKHYQSHIQKMLDLGTKRD
jgi:hypothetical protein